MDESPQDGRPGLGHDSLETADATVASFAASLRELTPRVFVTYGLVAINAVVFVWMLVSGVSPLDPEATVLVEWGANFAPLTTAGEWWRLLTATFLHIGVIHILFNMWVLLSAGPFAERLWGNGGFALLYVVSGLAGSLASTAWNPYLVSAGASGAIFGVFGGLLATLLLRQGAIPKESLAELRNSTLGFVGYNVLFGLTQERIDMAAHLGGLAAGFVCGFVICHPLTRSGARSRVGRALVAGVGGAAALAAGIMLVPRDANELQEVLAYFDRTERTVITTFNALSTQIGKGQLDDAEVLERLESQVLAPWREALRRLEEAPDPAPAVRGRFNMLLSYVRAREAGWELTRQAISENDTTKTPLARAKQEEAEKILRQLQALP